MKIDIENFGPIEKFSYDLGKDLIVTYGNNNIGKSYSMQIVYLLLKTLLTSIPSAKMIGNFVYAQRGLVFHFSIKEYEKIVQDFLDSGATVENITKKVIDGVYNTLNESFLNEFMNSCESTFGNLDKTLERNPMLHISFNDFNFDINMRERKIVGDIQCNPIFLKKTDSDFHKQRRCKGHLDIYVVQDTVQPAGLIADQVLKFINVWNVMLRKNYDNVFFLPASRSGIYSGMNAFGSIVAELSKNRAYFTKKIEFPGISEPISDYFISLSNIKPKSNENLEVYYKNIEDDILRGKVTFDKNRNALLYKPNNVDAFYEMTEVSSMVSEVSPIVAFFKYVLAEQGRRMKRGKSVLFIEEPEAHLHPVNQIKLIEIFAQIINADVKLIISSHSNYVFNKLNNLVLGKKLNYEVYQPIILEEYEKGSVSKPLSIDELGAEDENFIDVSEELYNEREENLKDILWDTS